MSQCSNACGCEFDQTGHLSRVSVLKNQKIAGKHDDVILQCYFYWSLCWCFHQSPSSPWSLYSTRVSSTSFSRHLGDPSHESFWPDLMELRGQRKKSNLKKCREELQLRVVGWFRGCAGWVRPRGCRGRLLGNGDLVGGRHAARAGSLVPSMSMTDSTLRAATIGDGDRAGRRRSGAVPRGRRAGRRHVGGRCLAWW